MSLLCVAQVCAQPDWSTQLDPADFEHNMAVRTSLIDACNSSGDIIGVFSSGGEIRGVSDPITNTDTFLITVFSMQSAGEELIFELYDNESDAIFDIAGVSFNFQRNTVLGLESPIVIPGQESVPPNMVCKDMIVHLDENGEASIVVDDIDNGSTDNCVIASRTLSRQDFSCSDLGDRTVILTIVDTYENSSFCEATVTVLDTIKPSPSCLSPTIYIDATGIASLTLADTDDGSFDNCNTLIRELSQSSFECVEKGSNNVTLTVRDASGNVNSCTSAVMVLDTIKPTANCNSLTVFLDETGAASITVGDINNNSVDNCTISSVVLDQMDFNCSELGDNTITMSVKDDSNNLQICNSIITVRDTIKPVVKCKNYTLALDEMGVATLQITDVNNGSFDNCSIETIVLSKTNFTCSDIGGQNVTMTVTDVIGNMDACTASVTIIDNLKPLANCKNINVELAANGSATIAVSDVNNASTDNCGIATRVISKSTFLKNEVRSQTITLTITDNVGLISSCMAQITIINNFENDIINCSDGKDNDEDGMVDCADADCGKPVLTNVLSVDPTPINCTSTQLDGSINMMTTGADIYSIDGGISIGQVKTFQDLVAGDYLAWAQNSETSCATMIDVVLNNTFDPLWKVKGLGIEGPQSLCGGLTDVSYSIDINEPFVNLRWTSSLIEVSETSVGTMSKLSFGDVEADYLVATVEGICLTVKDSIAITPSPPSFCAISNCTNDLFINNETNRIEGVPDVFRAINSLTSNAQITHGNKEFSAGQELVFISNFEIGAGASLLADIRSCVDE